jgi:hypothetical protein
MRDFIPSSTDTTAESICMPDRCTFVSWTGQGEIVLHTNMPCTPDLFLKAIAPYREDMAVAVECIFTWY